MLSFNKPKAFVFVACLLVCLSFVLAAIAMIAQGQPSNTAFIGLVSATLAATIAIVLGLDLRKESNTMKATVVIKRGVPVDVISDDIEDVHIMSLKQKLDRKKLTNRDITAHIIHYYEQKKALGFIKGDTHLQINFKEIEALEEISIDLDETEQQLNPETPA